MEEKLAGKDYLFIGSMLFGLFFGAGNLIFQYIWVKRPEPLFHKQILVF